MVEGYSPLTMFQPATQDTPFLSAQTRTVAAVLEVMVGEKRVANEISFRCWSGIVGWQKIHRVEARQLWIRKEMRRWREEARKPKPFCGSCGARVEGKTRRESFAYLLQYVEGEPSRGLTAVSLRRVAGRCGLCTDTWRRACAYPV